MEILSALQRDLVLGTLLGDGSMRCKRNPLLEINHCAAQAFYVDWKFRILSDFVRTPPKERTTNGARRACRFTTRSTPALLPIYRQFYCDGKKRIPNLPLSALALAVWFMDDGHRSYNAAYLNTQQFSDEDNARLARMLRDQFEILARPNRDKQYTRLRIAVSSMGTLREIVLPYLLPEFRYKVGLQ
jgi:hypothetical protein